MPLKRTLTLPLLIFYGLGSIIGAGIYALIGSVAHEAKEFTPWSFVFASIIALFTAATYAELSSRFPQSAGSSLYINKAFNKAWLSGLVGWFVVLTGVVSSGALVHGFINYLSLYLSLSHYILIPIIVILLGGITIWGITESALTIFLMTLLEVGGLLVIAWYGKTDLINSIETSSQLLPPLHTGTWLSILAGSFIAFYAFIGFEDMVNLAEETKNPEKIMPRAIIGAAICSIILYVLISSVLVTSLNINELDGNKTPLNLIIEKQGHSPLLFSIIAMISITNGILVNIIMASRLIYGMTKLNSAPAFFSYIHKKTQTPVNSTIAVLLSIIMLAYWLPIETLAKITSFIMLCVFCMMHLSLVIIKRKNRTNKGIVSYPIIIPIIGFILSLGYVVTSFLYH